MTRDTIVTTSADARIERYRQAERALWNSYGLRPGEQFIDLDSPAVHLRVLEVGSGEPVLFVHGTVGPARGRCLSVSCPGSAASFSTAPAGG